MRIALPGELVRRLRDTGGICAIMKDVLTHEPQSSNTSEGEDIFGITALHSNVSSIHIRISTYDELPLNKLYGVSLVIVSTGDDEARAVDKALSQRLSNTMSYNGVILQDLMVGAPDNVTLAMLNGHSRFNEWDDLSSLGARLVSMRELDT